MQKINKSNIEIKYIHGLTEYSDSLKAMESFINKRRQQSRGTFNNEIWWLQHPPIYTLGQRGKTEHILNSRTNINIVQSNRGGQVTYHGPGQLIGYLLCDIKQLDLNLRQFVSAIEVSTQQVLEEFNITSNARPEAPGVYIENRKICSLGLRIRHGYSFHGLAFNVDMDLKPFYDINPCGLKNITVTQLVNETQSKKAPSLETIITLFSKYLCQQLNYDLTPEIQQLQNLPY